MFNFIDVVGLRVIFKFIINLFYYNKYMEIILFLLFFFFWLFDVKGIVVEVDNLFIFFFKVMVCFCFLVCKGVWDLIVWFMLFRGFIFILFDDERCEFFVDRWCIFCGMWLDCGFGLVFGMEFFDR